MRTLVLVVYWVIAFPLGVLAAEDQNGSLIKARQITVNSATRSYDVYVPATLTTKTTTTKTTLPSGPLVPLVLLLHGHGGNSDVMTGENHKAAPYKIWLTLAEENQFIVAFPNGTAGTDGWLGWNDCRGDTQTNPTSDDVQFIQALVQQLKQDYSIDPRRIYASGTSNGGQMVLRLAVEMTDTFAAVAPVVAAMPAHSKCRPPTSPISILFMNGTKDPLSPYNGGEVAKDRYKRGKVLSTQASVEYWVNHNGASKTPVVNQLPDRSRRDGSRVVRESYGGGKQGTDVVLYKIVGGGHTEPSIQERYGAIYRLIVGGQNHDIEMADEVWAFFKNRRR